MTEHEVPEGWKRIHRACQRCSLGIDGDVCTNCHGSSGEVYRSPETVEHSGFGIAKGEPKESYDFKCICCGKQWWDT